MGALALYIEDEGIPTVQVSLVREHTAVIRPPRALWVPFMLGRPLGVPDDSAFQRRVVLAALRLFEREHGPVLEDYPEEAPAANPQEAAVGTVCPISFPADAAATSLTNLVLAEVGQLRSWYDIALERRRRTTLGVAGPGIEDLVRYIGAWSEGSQPAPYRDDLPPANQLRLACEEIKAFYFEADAGQPGPRSPARVTQWFWHQTAAGRLSRALEVATGRSEEASIRHFSRQNLVPRVARE